MTFNHYRKKNLPKDAAVQCAIMKPETQLRSNSQYFTIGAA